MLHYVLIINLVLHIPRITKGLIYTTSDLINAIVYDCRCKINMFQLISLTPSYELRDIVKNTKEFCISINTVYLLKTVFLLWKYSH